MITIENTLEMSDLRTETDAVREEWDVLSPNPNYLWRPAIAGMYEPAKQLAKSNCTKAAELAKQIHIQNYGPEASLNIVFRVKTIITVTTEPK